MRPIWFVAGVGAGAYAVLRARRVAEALTPEGVSDRLAGLRLGWEMFGDEVRTAMAEKETELRTGALPASAGAPDGSRALPPAPPPPPHLEQGEAPDGHQ